MSLTLELDIQVAGIEVLDAPDLIYAAWHEHAQEIADLERGSVETRTPRDTGALYESVTATANTNGTGAQLMRVYFDNEPQLFEWHRVYAQYQEGPPLGLSTYTNEPRQPIFSADPYDLPQIEEWAVTTAKDALP